MLLVLVLIIMVSFFMITYKADQKDKYGICIFTGTVAGIAFIAFMVMIIAIFVQHTGVNGEIAKNQAIYESLVYQAENDLYENDNDLGKKELANQIQEYNGNIAKGQALQHDFWVGIFYPNIYDQFETIPMDILKGE